MLTKDTNSVGRPRLKATHNTPTNHDLYVRVVLTKDTDSVVRPRLKATHNKLDLTRDFSGNTSLRRVVSNPLHQGLICPPPFLVRFGKHKQQYAKGQNAAKSVQEIERVAQNRQQRNTYQKERRKLIEEPKLKGIKRIFALFQLHNDTFAPKVINR